MTGPSRRRTRSMQTRSSSGPGTTKGTSRSSFPTKETSPSITSQTGHSTPDNSDNGESSNTNQPLGISIATRTRASTVSTRRRYSRSEGSIPDTLGESSRDQRSNSSSSSNITSNNSETSSRHTDTSTTQVDRATSNDVVLWIRENYEMMTNSNVPRSGIYEHYRHYCNLSHCESVNAATFGKLIRLAFPNITTRRLGNRGQSKYQYCNIQRRDVDTAVTGTTSTGTNIAMPGSSQGALSASSGSLSAHIGSHDSVAVASALADIYAETQGDAKHLSSTFNQATTSSSKQPQHYHHRQHHQHEDGYFNSPTHSVSGARGFPSYRLPPPISFTPTSSSTSASLQTPVVVPSTPTFLTGSDLVSDFSPSSSRPVTANPSSASTSRQHPSSIILPPVDLGTSASTANSQSSSSSSGISLSSSTNISYFRAAHTWDPADLSSKFAESYNHHCQEIYDAIRSGNFVKLQDIYDSYYRNMPPYYRALMNAEEMIESIWRWDCVLYDSLIADILPKVDTPTTEQMMSGLRYCTRFLPRYLNELLQSYPTMLKKKKVDVASIFTAKMRRHLTLNQFAIAAGDVVRQPALLEAMKADWKGLDIAGVLDHVLWVCDCPNDTMQQILGQDMANLLAAGSSLEQWIKWEEKMVDKFLPPLTKINEIKNIQEYLNQAKQFILKWKMYSGLIMQQFYMKNVSSIDSFKTLQFFFDDLVLYHVEERISRMNADINKRLSPARASTVNFPFSFSAQASVEQ